MLVRFVSLILSYSICTAASSDWSGEYQDNTFGGSLFVCTTSVTESDATTTIIGQGVFSQFGYLRGEVVGNQWEGEFFMAGLEARRGSFNFSLDDSGASYSGVFIEKVGYSYGMGGAQVSAEGFLPDDTDCFKSNAALLSKAALSDVPYSYTSNSVSTKVGSDATQEKVAYSDENNEDVSLSWEASFGIGFNYGRSFINGQVVCANWYEANAKEGIELFVAKDVNSFYSVWLASSSVSVFNYTQVVIQGGHSAYGVETNNMVDTLATAEEGRAYSYFRLLTSDDEATCEAALAGESLNCDDDDDNIQILAILVAVLIIIGSMNFFFLIYYNGYRGWCCGTQKEESSDMKEDDTALSSPFLLPRGLSEQSRQTNE